MLAKLIHVTTKTDLTMSEKCVVRARVERKVDGAFWLDFNTGSCQRICGDGGYELLDYVNDVVLGVLDKRHVVQRVTM